MTSSTAPTRLECRFSRGPLFFAFLGSGVFVVLGLAILTGVIGGAPTEFDRIGGMVIGALCVLFFGGIAVKALVTVLRTGPGMVLAVTDDGFFDRRIGPQPIPWSEIRGVAVRSGPTLPSLYLRFIELDVVDPDRFRGGPPNSMTRLADRLNRVYGFKPLVLSAAVLDHGIEEIVTAIRSHLPQAPAGTGS